MARAKRTAAKRRMLADNRTLDAFPDKIDLRDWPYQPTLAPLPDQTITLVNP